MSKQGAPKNQTPDPDMENHNSDLDELLDEKTAPTTDVELCMIYRLVEARNAANVELRAAERAHEKDMDEESAERLATAQKAVEQTTAAAEAKTVKFQFEAIGRRDYEVLMKAHPASKKERDEFDAQVKRLGLPRQAPLQYSEATFPPALMAASCVSPGMSYKQAQRIWNSSEFSRAEAAKLFQAAIDANNLIAK